MLNFGGVNISPKKIRFRLPEFSSPETKRLTLMQTGKIKRQLPAGRGTFEFFGNRPFEWEIDLLGPRVEVKAMTYIDPLPKPIWKQ